MCTGNACTPFFLLRLDKTSCNQSPLNEFQEVYFVSWQHILKVQKSCFCFSKRFSSFNMMWRERYMAQDTSRPAVISHHWLLWCISTHLYWKRVCYRFPLLEFACVLKTRPWKMEQRMRKSKIINWPYASLTKALPDRNIKKEPCKAGMECVSCVLGRWVTASYKGWTMQMIPSDMAILGKWGKHLPALVT